MLESLSDYILFASCLFILFGCAFLTFKTQFIQIRFFPELIKMIKESFAREKQLEGHHTIRPHKALFTAMSTTLGIGTIVAPVIAIRWGGPGALLGFLLTSFLGSAATYVEVNLCIAHRKRMASGEILGGPMQYLRTILSPKAAAWYAVCGSMLIAAWSAAQANQLAAILDSPLLGNYRIPTYFSGFILAVVVMAITFGGIKRVSAFSAKLVPLMFFLYLGSITWILIVNIDQLGRVFTEIVESAFSPYAMATGSVVGGFVSAMRWGVFKGAQVTEAGVGTQTIPHSMAETEDGHAQGMLAMLSTYTAGIIAFLSGCVAIITQTWQDPDLPLGISMVAASFYSYFSVLGIAIVTVSAVLFALGTILGNSYNGGQCFGYMTGNKNMFVYYLVSAIVIFLGAVSEVKTVWSIVDIGLAGLVLPHMFALIRSVAQEKEAASLS